MKVRFKSEQGSTSILVIILTVVLIILGLTILTTSLSNSRLAAKKQIWLSEYYQLEGLVADELADIDAILQQGKEEAVNSMSQDRKALFSDELLAKGLDVTSIGEDSFISFEVYEEDKEVPKAIRVELKVILPENSVSDDLFLKERNYKVVKYIEQQEFFEFTDQPLFDHIPELEIFSDDES